MVDKKDEQYDGEEDEYHFSDDQVNYETDTDISQATKDSSSNASNIKSTFFAKFNQNRKIIIGLAAFLILIGVVYKIVIPSSTAPSTEFTENAPATVESAQPSQNKGTTIPSAPSMASSTESARLQKEQSLENPSRQQIAGTSLNPQQAEGNPQTAGTSVNPQQTAGSFENPQQAAGALANQQPAGALENPQQAAGAFANPQQIAGTSTRPPMTQPSTQIAGQPTGQSFVTQPSEQNISATSAPYSGQPEVPQSVEQSAAQLRGAPPTGQPPISTSPNSARQTIGSSVMSGLQTIQQPSSNSAAPNGLSTLNMSPTSSMQTGQQIEANRMPPVANLTPPPAPASSSTTEPQEKNIMNRLASLEQQNAAIMNLLQTEYAQKISDNETQNTASRGKMEELTKRLNRMEAAVNQMTQIAQGTMRQNPSEMPSSAVWMGPPQTESAKMIEPKMSYSVQAIIPGRAWLKSDAGDTVTVAEGDLLKGFGRITKIDPYDGVVNIDTGNKVLTLSYGMNAE